MNIISIDPSKASTGIYYKVDGFEYTHCISHKQTASIKEVMSNLYNIFGGLLHKYRFDLGLIEGYGFNPKKRKALIPLCEIGGVIRLLFYRKHIPLIEIPIQIWKARFKIQIDKRKKPADYVQFIASRFNWKVAETIDEADAYLIYQAAREILKSNEELTPAADKLRKKLIETVKNTNGGKK